MKRLGAAEAAESIATGIEERNRVSGPNLLPNVNPTFSWVRLAQRVPVRIARWSTFYRGPSSSLGGPRRCGSATGLRLRGRTRPPRPGAEAATRNRPPPSIPPSATLLEVARS